MLFSVSGSRTETMGDKINAYNMYNQTLHLIKYVMKLTTSKNAKKDIDIRSVLEVTHIKYRVSTLRPTIK